jgi:SAM-dependent methyltransferase
MSQKRDIRKRMVRSLERLTWFHDSAESMTGIALRDKQILEIGHGQMPLTAAFVASLGNDVHGIDLDETPSGLLDVRGYYRLARRNGLPRACKTLVRHLTGINGAIKAEFLRQRGLTAWPPMNLAYGDATAIPHADASIDFVYSFNVFEHLADPAKAIQEIIRILRPGGGMWLVFPHYAHANALHDMRWITGAEDAPVPWAHLIPKFRETVEQGAFVNTLRISDWESLFRDYCRGVAFATRPIHDRRVDGWLDKHRACHFLSDFSDEELLTDEMVVAWNKPK